MDFYKLSLLFVGFVAVLHIKSFAVVSGLQFKHSPENITSSLGKPVEMQCVLMMEEGDEEYEGPPDVLWFKEGQPLEFSDTNQVQMPFDDDTWLVISTLRIANVQLSDMGAYHCSVIVEDEETVSMEGHLQLEGLPHFSVEPVHMSVVANVNLSLQCVAHGPPEPVHIIWLQDGAPLNTLEDPIALSPSRLDLTGLNKTSSFSCEAHNRKGVASSSSGVITVLPSQPQDVKAVEITNSSIRLSWSPGFAGIYTINLCTVQVALDIGLLNELSVNASLPNITFRLRAYTRAGYGPWTQMHTLSLIPADVSRSTGQPSSSVLSWHWWYVVMAVAVAIGLAVLMAIYMAKLRRKETRFGEAFEPMMESGELVVRYRARRTYSRRTNEATLNSLGISDELKQKLQDVMVDRHKLTLGKTLGEGEFGSVMEGLLTQEDSVLKVAVKTMKIAICTRTEMEDFLREAACMKEFDHQNVMRLLGVCLQTVESEGFPSPVVILPYMKHGDLHSYLLYSRLGDSPVYLPSQMLVKFMTDIARGMEYLSSKNFIHRDLAARNCMLNENMNVCVADFGLSKKIYNGDYYRQGRISKMPVKWIAIESLADRVYTTKSDVWSFGVTMWEIATRGQTPYPGVENSEIYDYLRQGNRLKQPPDCLDS
ncbi:tyrosine-protein kinase receptor UFO isoform X3, partial [Clarias magur]